MMTSDGDAVQSLSSPVDVSAAVFFSSYSPCPMA